MVLLPENLGASERYKLLIGAIVPRPIAWVSTVSPRGEPNLAPYSFFNGVGSNPMLLLFCPANKIDGSEKDSLRNAKPASEGGQGEFVVNVVPRALCEAMAACAAELAYGHSEWDLAKVTPAPSERVKPARVAESPVAFECVTRQVIRTNGTEPAAGNIVIGEVVAVWVAEGVVNERLHVNPAVLDAVGRVGGPNGYATTRDRFEVKRGAVGG